MYVRVSLRGMLRLTRVDTLRRVHSVDFFLGTAHMESLRFSDVLQPVTCSEYNNNEMCVSSSFKIKRRPSKTNSKAV